MPTVINDIQGYEEIINTKHVVSILLPVQTAQPNTTNKSPHNQLHSTFTSADQSLPKIITISPISESTNNHTLTSLTNINISSAC